MQKGEISLEERERDKVKDTKESVGSTRKKATRIKALSPKLKKVDEDLEVRHCYDDDDYDDDDDDDE